MAVNKITINTGGKDRLFRFDMYAMEVFIKNESKYKGQFADAARMLHAGLESVCYAQDKDNDFTKEDVLDMLEEMALTKEGQEKLRQISDCMAQSQVFKSGIEQSQKTEDGEEKKTLIGTGYTLLHLEKSA